MVCNLKEKGKRETIYEQRELIVLDRHHKNNTEHDNRDLSTDITRIKQNTTTETCLPTLHDNTGHNLSTDITQITQDTTTKTCRPTSHE